MTRFLRSHPFLTTGVSLALLILGAWLLFWRATDDYSDFGMIMTYAGFIAFCAGCVGIMILVFRPLVLSELGPARWEAIRAEGKGRFVWRRFLFAIPFLFGLLIAMLRGVKSETLYSDISRGLIVIAVFAGGVLLAASEIWKHFERQHQEAQRSGHQPDVARN